MPRSSSKPAARAAIPAIPATPAPASVDRDSLEASVLRSLNRYFADLDGAQPHPLHDMVMNAVERPLLVFALERTAGNQSAAAELLGINRNTLRKKLSAYGLLS